MMKRRAFVGLVLSLVMTHAIRADVRVPAIFGSHMVLQQKESDQIWGWGDPGENISVKIADQNKTTQAGSDGRWRVALDPMPAGGPHQLVIQGKNEIVLEDVLIGEVWICSGQSNMQWDVNSSNDADLEPLTAKYPNIRLISVPQVGTQEPQETFQGSWTPCTPESVRTFSAVGYYFGRQIHETIDVPVGLIDNAWGGSAAEAWVNRKVLEQDGRFEKLMSDWKEREKNNPNDNAMKGNQRPANIYNGVLKPTIGYGIRGVIWYQGESNAGRAYQYRDLFPLMIQNWRDEWRTGDFSFYWVQLADFNAEATGPTDSTWAELREAQTMTMELGSTGEAVILNLGEAEDIHPKNKQDVAKRLARWALANDYGYRQLAHRSPLYGSMKGEGNHILLTFQHVGGGLDTFDVKEPKGFTIAGEDKVFHPAKAEIQGEGVNRKQIKVWSDQVPHPVAVRYAWADNPVCNVQNVEGLPLTPFRTDTWPGITMGK